MTGRSASSCDGRFGLTECARATILKASVALVVIVGAGLLTGDRGWYTLAAVVIAFSTLLVGVQMLLRGDRCLDDQNRSVNSHAR